MYILPKELARELQQVRELAAHWDEIQSFFDSLKDFEIPPIDEGKTDIVAVGNGQSVDHFDFSHFDGWDPDAGPDDGPNPWPWFIEDLINKGPFPDVPDLPAEAIKGLDFDPTPSPMDVFEMGL